MELVSVYYHSLRTCQRVLSQLNCQNNMLFVLGEGGRARRGKGWGGGGGGGSTAVTMFHVYPGSMEYIDT